MGAQRTHTSRPIRVITPFGSVDMRQVLVTHKRDQEAGPDPNDGHIFYDGDAAGDPPAPETTYSEATANDPDRLNVTLYEDEQTLFDARHQLHSTWINRVTLEN